MIYKIGRFLFKEKHIYFITLGIWLFNFFYFNRMVAHKLLFPDLWIIFAVLSSLYFLLCIIKIEGLWKKILFVLILLSNIYFYFYFGVALGFEWWYYDPNFNGLKR